MQKFLKQKIYSIKKLINPTIKIRIRKQNLKKKLKTKKKKILQAIHGGLGVLQC